jgi:rhodanese-related sulfurtransferase/DNA-binding MarR family transcriptional regulator
VSREVKDPLYEHFARVGKVLGSPKRIELLDLLAQAERSVEDLAHLTGMEVANTSAHLQVMRGARLVEVRRMGTRVFYRLASDEVTRLLVALQEAAHSRLAEVGDVVRAHLSDPAGLEAVGRQELLERAGRGEVVVLDVRPVEEYRAGHIPGALSIPVDELEARLEELPEGVEIVAYCRGPYCVFARDAVALLRARGRPARRLVDGLPEWRLAALPVAAGQVRS